MVFSCVFYVNFVQMHGIIIICICTGQYTPMYTLVLEVVTDMKMIYIDSFIIEVNKRVIIYIYNFFRSTFYGNLLQMRVIWVVVYL